MEYKDAYITCDSAEPKSVADYRAMGLPAKAAVKGPGSVDYGMKWLQRRKIVIDRKRTPNAYNEFVNYEYDWCFDGEPVGGIVAVSSVGTQQNKESKRLFLRGYEEMMKRLSPEWVIFYGKVPEECDWNVIRVKPHYDDIVKRRKANEISVSAGNT